MYECKSVVFGDSIKFDLLIEEWLCCAEILVENLTGDSVQPLVNQTDLKRPHQAGGSLVLQSFLNSLWGEFLFQTFIQK